MSEKNKNEDTSISNNINHNNITIKRSTYNNLIKGIIATIAIAAFAGGYSLGTFGDSDVTREELKEILSEIEIKPAQASQPVQQPTQPPSQIIQISLDDDPVKGDADAPITIVEFSDFQCPFCNRFFQQTLPLLEENYIDTGKIKLVYRDLPLDNIHPNARLAHISAECADEQGKFWEYHDMLFENQAQWSKLSPTDLDSQLKQYASSLGLNSVSFESCLGSQTIADEVNADYLQGVSYGATGTPTFFIGTQEDGFTKLVGAQPYAVFQSVIDNQLKLI